MSIMAQVNNKGGVGKTTLTLHLAVHFAKAGLRVICIDADTQANLTSLLLDGAEASGIYDLLVARKTPNVTDFLRPVTFGGQHFGLLPGEEYQAAMGMLAMDQRLATVTERLKMVAGYADVTLIDMPPSKAIGFEAILSTADYLLIPTIMERLSIEGVAKIMETSAEVGVQLMGIIPNMVRAVSEHKTQGLELLTVLREMGRPDLLWPPIPQSIRVAEAKAAGMTIFDYDPPNPVAVALTHIGDNALKILRSNGL